MSDRSAARRRGRASASSANEASVKTGPSPLAALPSLIIILAGLGAYASVASTTVVNGLLNFDEVAYIVKAWWYISGVVMPFSASDASPVMPVYPYALGALQKFIGLSAETARIAMAALGVLNGVLLFLLCRKLTANALASAAAVLIFLGSPATSYSFTIATPIAVVSFLHLSALWFLVLGLGRPRWWLTIAMGVVLTAMSLSSSDMLIPSLMLAGLFIAASGRGRALQALILIATIAALMVGAVYLLPDPFTAFLLSQPIPLLILNLAGLAPVGAPAMPSYDAVRISQDLIEGAVLPYGGTILLCLILFVLTLKGPRVLWVIPFYFITALLALMVFRTPGCEACVATAPSQIIAMGAIGAAMALAFLARRRRQNNGSGGPVIIGGAAFALALNTFGPSFAMREPLQFFPAEMVKQARPAAEQQEINALMRVVGENVPGTERVLILHKLPSLPYAVHMAGRRFPAISLNPLAGLRSLPASVTGTNRETMLAVIERTGGWTGETLRRWIERDYDTIILQENILALDAASTETLGTEFDVIATTDFRGAKLLFYKRKN